MEKLKVFLAVAACKLTRFALRVLRRGGTALPGKVAMRLYPDLLGVLSRGVNVIAVTGTNGKTTSSRIVEQALLEAGADCFSNRSGSNLMQGVTADFCAQATLGGRVRRDWAVIECDEAAAKQLFPLLRPKAVLVTNVFRDQLDRYGEVTHTLENIRIGLSAVPETLLCLNADCPLTASLAEKLPNRVTFFGVDADIYKSRVEEVSDAKRCLRCGAEYAYSHINYGHLGTWHCPSCGAARPDPQVCVTEIFSQTTDGARMTLTIDGQPHECYVNLPGGYNIYNAAGAAAVVTTAGFPVEAALAATADFNCGFGRMEKFTLGSAEARMILIKNPAGCNQVLNFLRNQEGEALFVICLNDNFADGTDVSWIWDVNFENLLELGERLTGVIVSGTRAWDMALRLKYAGIPKEKLRVCTDWDALLREITAQDKPVFIMPTYTAMLSLREKISRDYGYKQFWE